METLLAFSDNNFAATVEIILLATSLVVAFAVTVGGFVVSHSVHVLRRRARRQRCTCEVGRLLPRAHELSTRHAAA